MKKAFTLIELIFVIVIIGLLAAVAVPKFLNLKQHAQASSVVKTTVDAAQQAVEAAINWQDMENNASFTLQDLVNLRGKGWSYSTPTDTNGSYEYNVSNKIVAEINLSVPSREVNYSINCNSFADPKTKAECAKLIGKTDTKTTGVVTLSY